MVRKDMCCGQPDQIVSADPGSEREESSADADEDEADPSRRVAKRSIIQIPRVQPVRQAETEERAAFRRRR